MDVGSSGWTWVLRLGKAGRVPLWGGAAEDTWGKLPPPRVPGSVPSSSRGFGARESSQVGEETEAFGDEGRTLALTQVPSG